MICLLKRSIIHLSYWLFLPNIEKTSYHQRWICIPYCSVVIHSFLPKCTERTCFGKIDKPPRGLLLFEETESCTGCNYPLIIVSKDTIFRMQSSTFVCSELFDLQSCRLNGRYSVTSHCPLTAASKNAHKYFNSHIRIFSKFDQRLWADNWLWLLSINLTNVANIPGVLLDIFNSENDELFISIVAALLISSCYHATVLELWA